MTLKFPWVGRIYRVT